MKWYYVDGPLRVGPLTETEWAELVRSGKIQPDTLVWHEALTKWTPYSQVPPEPAPEIEPPLVPETVEEGEEPAEAGTPEEFAARVAERPFAVGIRSGVAKSWHLLFSNFWMVVGSTLLIYVLLDVGASIPILAAAVPLALKGVLMGGLYLVYLRLMRGQPATVSDLFSGFAPGIFRNLALQTLVTTLVTFACFIPLVIAILISGVEKLAAPGADIDFMTILVLSLIALTCSIPAVYFGFCWIFSVPLVIEKGMPFWEAMKLSRRKVLQHPWRISLLLSFAGLIAALPSMAIMLIACILWEAYSGALPTSMNEMQRLASFANLPMAFTLPVYIGALLYLYEDVFGDGSVSADHPLTPEETETKAD